MEDFEFKYQNSQANPEKKEDNNHPNVMLSDVVMHYDELWELEQYYLVEKDSSSLSNKEKLT